MFARRAFTHGIFALSHGLNPDRPPFGALVLAVVAEAAGGRVPRVCVNPDGHRVFTPTLGTEKHCDECRTGHRARWSLAQRKKRERDRSLPEVARRRVTGPHVSIHKGLIPGTFEGLEQANIAFAHIDVDIYKSVWDCCSFIYERLIPGGFMSFDDYGFADCPGARQAVDEFFGAKRESPLVLPTSQAIIFASSAGRHSLGSMLSQSPRP